MRREVEWALLQSRSSSLTTIMILPILSSEDFPCADGIFLLTVHAHVALRFAHAMPSRRECKAWGVDAEPDSQSW
jgi:hypothetical protein